MTDVVCDASVVLKWFHAEDEPEAQQARILLDAHRQGRIGASILDLTLYELGNVLRASLRWRANDVASQLEDLREMFEPVAPAIAQLRLAAQLAERHRLTFYDAAYAAVARSLDAALATTDTALLDARLGESPSRLVRRLRLDLRP